MLTADDFLRLVFEVLHRNLNAEQLGCVRSGAHPPLLIIAGPGTGKTTVMVLRALRHVLVDRMAPESIVITTFTKKAAQEVRTRWLDWGLPLLDAARRHATLSAEDRLWLERVDLNRCVTGTLDSLCEQLLSEYREAGTVPPVLIDEYPANQRLLRSGLWAAYRGNEAAANAYLQDFAWEGRELRTQGEMLRTTRPLLDRFVHDRVDRAAFVVAQPHQLARALLSTAYTDYQQALEADAQLDFALLEHVFLERLAAGRLDEVVRPWRALLVDEYQDTNPLQEHLYFEIIRRSGASLSVVGDDDQSLYRFRGATVELFTRFVERLAATVGVQAQVQYLYQNYRSTPEVAAFFNRFILTDPAFSPARIQPPKPVIHATRASLGLPVLGMFRDDPAQLAADLSEFLLQVFRGGGAAIALPDGRSVPLAGAVDGGDFGDAVVLGHSVAEYGRAAFGKPPSEKFALHLRRALDARGVPVFNPRGQDLSDQPAVQVLLGLVLECVDRSTPATPEGTLTPALMGLTQAARTKLMQWRQRAAAFLATRPAPGGLDAFVDAWARSRDRPPTNWPDDWPVLELLFKLIAWMPGFQYDPEHQVWLEAISRACSQARLFSPYGGLILKDAPHHVRSRESVIRDILRPVAEDVVDIDEELVTSTPRDRLSLMTIHQSKGLEFPLVIVDVSSNYRRNHHLTAAMRFPRRASSVALMEDDLAPFTPIGAARTQRSAMDRSFDDLVRLYYVAYSRAQTALLLIGNEKSLATATTVRSVASGWRRDESWAWHDAGNGRSTFANALPMTQI